MCKLVDMCVCVCVAVCHLPHLLYCRSLEMLDEQQVNPVPPFQLVSLPPMFYMLPCWLPARISFSPPSPSNPSDLTANDKRFLLASCYDYDTLMNGVTKLRLRDLRLCHIGIQMLNAPPIQVHLHTSTQAKNVSKIAHRMGAVCFSDILILHKRFPINCTILLNAAFKKSLIKSIFLKY